jgi:H+/Cl- antiporter ClcA
MPAMKPGPERWQRTNRALERLRLRVAAPDALLQLSLLGVITGLFAGVVIVLLRLLIETLQTGFLPSGDTENYEGLAPWLRFCLPVVGGLLIGLVFKLLAKDKNSSGIVELLERMAYHQGYISMRRAVLQFLGAAIAIVSGHSVGREGPSVYLGGATGSLLGQNLSLPNNSIRTMVGCGTAAAIAASFNTPLAGVIFALEVVMMEYTVASFIPVMLAAVSATTISHAIYGADPAFFVPAVELGSLLDLPTILVLGLVAGTASAVFIKLSKQITHHSKELPYIVRTTLAGIAVGFIAVFYPEVMGIGYDTVNATLIAEFSLTALAGITLAKLLATSCAIGFGIPAGLIGPTLVMGASMGALVGGLAKIVFPEIESDTGLYALLGMGAMMGATLQAPLSALTAMLELTSNPYIIMPGMLVIVTAALTSSQLFGQRSIFLSLLNARGLDYAQDPVMQALQRTGVGNVLDQRFAELTRRCPADQASNVLQSEPHWIVINDEQHYQVMPAIDLARHTQDNDDPDIDLLAIPADRLQTATIPLQSTLLEALQALESASAEILIVTRSHQQQQGQIHGVLTRSRIEEAYRLV